MTEPSAATVSPPDRHRARSVSSHERLFLETAPMRRAAVRLEGRWTPDAAAAVDAAVWEAIHSGVTSPSRLYSVARQAAYTERSWDLRLARRPPILPVHPANPADQAIEVADAELQVRRLLVTVPAPSEDVAMWIDRKMGRTAGDRLPSKVKMAGTRWAARARYELRVRDEVA